MKKIAEQNVIFAKDDNGEIIMHPGYAAQGQTVPMWVDKSSHEDRDLAWYVGYHIGSEKHFTKVEGKIIFEI